MRGGENISSREVEDIVLEYPGVREAAVVAMPDERLGERSCACVSMRPGAPALHLTDLVAFFDGRRVAKYKFPEYLVVLDALRGSCRNLPWLEWSVSVWQPVSPRISRPHSQRRDDESEA